MQRACHPTYIDACLKCFPRTYPCAISTNSILPLTYATIQPQSFHPPICPATYFFPIVMSIIVLPNGLYSLTCATSLAVNTESRAADRWTICASVTVSGFVSTFPTSPIPHALFVSTTRIVWSKRRLPAESSRLDGRKLVFTCTPKSGRYKSATRVEPLDSVRVVCCVAASSSPFAFVACTCVLRSRFTPSFCRSLSTAWLTLGKQ